VNEIDKIHMTNEPLLTEEGFVNQAAINELEAAIRNMPSSYERNANDTEWTVKRWTFLSEITGMLAEWAIRQSPYSCPDDLEIVIRFLSACLQREFEKLKYHKDATSIMVEVSLCQINKWLHEILITLPQVVAWNTAKDGDKRQIRYSDRYGSDATGPDNDLLDLDALFSNVCVEIRNERRRSDKFNREFEEEQAK